MGTPVIRILPVEIANRIAAGEVVERPSSVVKELVENALDAGAEHVEVELEDGGLKLIRVRDDGAGMTPEDLMLCIRSHATSKIASLDDLFRIASFGFRGEALPSIASVSELTILTRQAGSELGSRLASRDGVVEGPIPAGGPVGTTVEVRQLFCTVPARRKFLKGPRTELTRCLETLTRLLLPDPSVHLRVTHEGRQVMEVPSDKDRRTRIGSFFGRDLATGLLEVREQKGDLALEAYVGPPSLVRSHRRQQFLFLNGRYIADRALLVAFKEAYRGLVMPKDYPVGFLFLSMNPAEVDVNVHPTKTEVRFRDKDRIFGFVRNAVRSVLESGGEARPLRMGSRTGGVGRGTVAPNVARADMLAELEQELFGSAGPAAPLELREGPSVPRKDPASPSAGFRPVEQEDDLAARNPCRTSGRVVPRPDSRGEGTPRFLQIHRSYIVVESPDGLWIVDQHALHERRLFEELMRRFATADGEDQRLLVPEVVDLGAADAALMLERRADLLGLGIEIDSFGGTSIVVRTVPMSLSRLSAEELIHDLIGTLKDSHREITSADLVHDVAAGLACRAAVKFNDPLPEEEIRDLLRWADAHPDSRNCPHGRPVRVAVTLRELENQFQRKV